MSNEKKWFNKVGNRGLEIKDNQDEEDLDKVSTIQIQGCTCPSFSSCNLIKSRFLKMHTSILLLHMYQMCRSRQYGDCVLQEVDD